MTKEEMREFVLIPHSVLVPQSVNLNNPAAGTIRVPAPSTHIIYTALLEV